MHDPMTVAFEIRYPWYEYKPWPKGVRKWEQMTPEQQRGRDRVWREGYRTSAVTIWHNDPERNGSDDSCGWCFPKLTSEQADHLKNWAWSEGQYPYFLRRQGREWTGTRHEAECLYRGLVLMVADAMDLPMTFDEAARYAARHIHQPDCTDTASALCFEPGYHTNFPQDAPEHRQDRFHGILCAIASNLLRQRRPWWRHPRWHIHHWRIQVHFTQAFKRWAFSRCCKCGHRFPWGYAPVSNQWGGAGPRWFRGERDVMHHECSGASAK